MPEIIGWGSALILLPAFGLQTYRQWKNRHEPVNLSALWFFVLVLIGTGGQVVYSWMVHNWVYLALNSALVINNGIGLGIAIQRWKSDEPAGTSHSPVDASRKKRVSAPSSAMHSETDRAGLRGQPIKQSSDDDEGGLNSSPLSDHQASIPTHEQKLARRNNHP